MPKGYYAESHRTLSSDNRPVVHPRAITLAPRQVVAAICFHLIDENLAARVDGGSIRRQIARLEADRLHVMMLRHEWRGMTNLQRLHCLLSASEIAYIVLGAGHAVLLTNDEDAKSAARK
jgi:hypothetical protein